MKVPEEVNAIVEAIVEAFAGVRRGAITLHEALVIDGYGSEAQRRQARQQDTERSWVDVPATHLERGGNAIAHFDPVSWRYYLPAFMVWVLANFRTSSSIAIDFSIYTLDPGQEDSGLRQYHEQRFRLLDEAQSAAVAKFLRHMARDESPVDVDAARRALDGYWGRFGGGS